MSLFLQIVDICEKIIMVHTVLIPERRDCKPHLILTFAHESSLIYSPQAH